MLRTCLFSGLQLLNKWYLNFDRCSRISIFESQGPIQFLDPLLHPTNAYANASGPQIQHLRSRALAIISYFQNNVIILPPQSNPCMLSFRVAKDVRQGFLNDAENRGFKVGRKPGKLRRLYI